MPISYGTYDMQLKLLPLVLHEHGGADVTVRYGFVVDGEFRATSQRMFTINASDVSTILDADPTPGLTRRDDLSLAVYAYLVAQGLVEAGEIS